MRLHMASDPQRPGTAPVVKARPRRVLVLGATGTIGQATTRALVARGHEVVCFIRARAGVGGRLAPADIAQQLAGASLRVGDLTDPDSWTRDAFRGEAFDGVVSCLVFPHGCT